MNVDELETLGRAQGSRLRAGTVIEVVEGGDIGVVVPGDPARRLQCDVLRTASSPALALALGARVLVLLPEPGEERGCVLGVVEPYRAPRPERDAAPARLQLEAQQELSLRCGESSLTLHADGQVLLKGVDVVSRAKRTQKIRGGTVHIN